MCIFPTAESRERTELKTSQAEFTSLHPLHLTDEPQTGLSVTGGPASLVWPCVFSYYTLRPHAFRASFANI